MDLTERIERRRMRTRNDRILVDRSALSPTAHLADPVGRAPVLESLLDAVEPVFDGQRPPELVVEGPRGVGKSALVDALYGALGEMLDDAGSIATSTRGGAPERWFASVDCRYAGTGFRFYRQLLLQLGAEEVPRHGVGTDRLREQVVDRLSPAGRWAVVTIDHVSEATDLDPGAVRELLAPVADSVSITWVGRELDVDADRVVAVDPYRKHELTDVLSHRCSRGLRTDAFDHDDLRALSGRHDGNAHDALAVALGAALLAEHEDDDAIERRHLRAADDAVPADTVHLDAVLALPENRRRVLAALVRLDPHPTVADAAAAIAERTELTQGTVRRFCYELAEAGVLARRGGDAPNRGRDPSHLAPAFPWLAFAAFEDALSVADAIERLDREVNSAAVT
jgi:Cdc6-like AAA superfamily ATPase